jgi:hypothetical protein
MPRRSCRSVAQANVGAPATLMGSALLLAPLALLKSTGSAALPVRLQLSHGDGSLFVRLSLQPAPTVDDAMKAATDSALPNKICACPLLCRCSPATCVANPSDTHTRARAHTHPLTLVLCLTHMCNLPAPVWHAHDPCCARGGCGAAVCGGLDALLPHDRLLRAVTRSCRQQRGLQALLATFDDKWDDLRLVRRCPCLPFRCSVPGVAFWPRVMLLSCRPDARAVIVAQVFERAALDGGCVSEISVKTGSKDMLLDVEVPLKTVCEWVPTALPSRARTCCWLQWA